jgi:hypothetical protein
MSKPDLILDPQNIHQLQTDQLKQLLLQSIENRDTEPLRQKIKDYQQLEPLILELSQRNPYQDPLEQIPIVIGRWSSVWTTIPFQDILPGRIRSQSYQIFHDDGYYANIARYAPGNKIKFKWLKKIASWLLAYDLMIIQTYKIEEDIWSIENVAIKQALRWRGVPLTQVKADAWFSKSMKSRSLASNTPDLKNLNQSTAKRINTAYRAKPLFEHLYIDSDLRIVKSQREAKQRPSYTIAVRLD